MNRFRWSCRFIACDPGLCCLPRGPALPQWKLGTGRHVRQDEFSPNGQAGPTTSAGAPLRQGRSNDSADVLRSYSHRLAGIVIATALAGPATAEEWPTRPLTMEAPFAAGGSTDAIARLVADGLSSQLQQTVIVENVGGAGGMTGANRVAKAAPDGYQFVLGNVGTHAQNQSLYKKPLYNALTDFAPVALVTDQSLVLVARKDFPADTLPEFIAYAKANQSKLQYGSAGVGGSNHLACVLLNAAIGIQVTHVPYRSGGQAMQDLLAGRVDYQCPSAPTAMPQID